MKKCKNDNCHRQACYSTTCEACLLVENQRMKNALHSITNMAHPCHKKIFCAAMEGLGLEKER